MDNCRPLRGLLEFSLAGSWGSAPLHPRLYAYTRSAGCLFDVVLLLLANIVSVDVVLVAQVESATGNDGVCPGR